MWLPFGRRSAIAEILLPDKLTTQDDDADDDGDSTDAPSDATDDSLLADDSGSHSDDDELQRAAAPLGRLPDRDGSTQTDGTPSVATAAYRSDHPRDDTPEHAAEHSAEPLHTTHTMVIPPPPTDAAHHEPNTKAHHIPAPHTHSREDHRPRRSTQRPARRRIHPR